MEILGDTVAHLAVPHGNIEMSQAVRYYLGQSLNVLRPDNWDGRHPTYEEDVSHIAKAMQERGYLGICALGPEGSNSHVLARDLGTALAQRQSRQQGDLENHYVDGDGRLRDHP